MGDDDIRDLPGIRVTDEDRVTAQAGARRSGASEPPVVRAVREPAPRRQRNGALWAVCLSLLIALAGLGYWSHQQQSQLQRQLVATQESFARISEEAAGRLQDISGKVVATESTLSQSEQSRAQQITRLEQQVAKLTAAQQTQHEQLQAQEQRLEEQRRGLSRLRQADETQAQQLGAVEALVGTLGTRQERFEQGAAELAQQAETAAQATTSLREEMQQLGERLEALATLERQLATQESELARQRGELEALLERAAGPSAAQEILVLRSEIDQRLAATEESLRSIDSFRLQTNRSLSTLRSQLGTLQQQLEPR